MEEVALPPETRAGGGFEPTGVVQFTIFLENRVGRLQKLVSAFEEERGRIVALSIEESAEAALVRIICHDPELGRAVLKAHGFTFGESVLLAVELPAGTTQPLIRICTALLAGEINIHSAYPLLMGPHRPTLALYVDDPTLAAQILMRKGFTLIGESDLGEDPIT